MDSKEIKLKKLDLGFESDVGAPMPIILADGRKLILTFYISGEPDKLRALITFEYYVALKFGMPNDEAIEGHPYYKLGLEPYSIYEVENSDWIDQLEKMNRVHPYHKKEAYDKLKHYLFFFHDENFECVGGPFKVERKENSVQELIKSFFQ
jgi:hypothetical protein